MMQIRRTPLLWLAGLLLAVGVGMEGQAQGANRAEVLHVANNGEDSPGCGRKAKPCRSIGQAIRNAAPGDTILVGPGRYGDLNSDNDFDDPGEEPAQPNVGFGCVVCVDKRVRVLSTDGAAATIVDGGNPVSDFPYVVFISASGVTFGERNRGFTIKEGQLIGLGANAFDVRVVGNVALNNPNVGFSSVKSIYASDNLAVGSDFGFSFEGDVVLRNNIATGNRLIGFHLGGPNGSLLAIGNTASANLQGFHVDGSPLVLRNNIASGNTDGFHVDGPDLTFVRNAALGNKLAGVYVGPSVTQNSSRIHRNNIFGNSMFSFDVATNCGLVNQYGNTIDATNNFWGAASGPGTILPIMRAPIPAAIFLGAILSSSRLLLSPLWSIHKP